MKFMVLCLLDASSPVRPQDAVPRGLESFGLTRVGSSRADDGSCVGIGHGFVGEFRAHDPEVLEQSLSKHIRACLPPEAPFKLFIRPLAASPVVRKRA
jgi:hypothetical protein